MRTTLRITATTSFKSPLESSLTSKETPKKIHRIAAVGRKMQVNDAIMRAVFKLSRVALLFRSLDSDPRPSEGVVDVCVTEADTWDWVKGQ